MIRLKVSPNMSILDRALRVIGGNILIALGPLGFDVIPGGFFGWFCTFFGLLNVVSSIWSWCPMYALVGVRSSSFGEKGRDDEGDTKPILKTELLRRKTVFGFGVITLIVSAVYLYESHDAAVAVARILEIERLHEKTLIFERLLKEGADSSSEIVSVSRLEEAAIDAGIALLVAISGGQEIVFHNGLDEQSLDFFLTQSRESQSVELSDDMSHRGSGGRAKVSENIEQYIQDYRGQEYVIMSHLDDDGMAITLIKVSSARSIVLDYLVNRMAWISGIVIWMGLWGGYGVALFVWRRIEQSNRSIIKAANTDALTGLPNERSLKAAFIEGLEKRTFGKVRVHVFQCRSFQSVLMDHGSDIASQLIKVMAERLISLDEGYSLLGRLNDGNIMIITHDAGVNNGFATSDVMRELEVSVRIDNYMFAIEPTKVFLSYPKDADNFDDLVKYAALTMSKANSEKVTVLNFIPDFLYSNTKKYQYASEIRSALIDGDLVLHFQPKMNLKTNRPDSAEALIRWNHKEDGLIYPGAFLDIIEDSNVRTEFCLFVIEKSVEACAELKAQDHEVSIAFNLSSYDVVDPMVLETFTKAVNRAGLEHHAFQIELTEGETTVNIEQIIGALKAYSKLGCRIAIDDFGMGMSSLSYCHRLPVDTVKIDRTFTQRLTEQKKSRVMVNAIMDIADNFQWEVVAEGVETVDVADTLIELGCDYAQGYFYAKPMPFDDLVDYLQSHR